MSHGILLAALCLGLTLPASADLPLPKPVTPEDYVPFDPALARIGQLLFYDPILSGNRNISCGTCHHHDLASADGVALSLGEGGVGLGPARRPGPDGIVKRIPRNAPALWNVGAREYDVLFHDGRVSLSPDYDNGFDSPAEEWLPSGLNGLLAVQALFPLVAQFEMAGNPGENEIAGAVHDRIDAAWPLLAARVRAIPAYRALFAQAGIAEPQIADIANALADFMNAEWRSTDSPFDRFLAGAPSLSPAQERGLALFYGKAGCAACHAGPLLTDHRFYALALPPLGPGRTRRWDPFARDVGRMAESNRLEDAYRFRTPSLRNVALTAPYGHNGTMPGLEDMVRHHLDPMGSLARWRPAMAALPPAPGAEATDLIVWQDKREMARLRARLDIAPRVLSDAEIADIIAFLHALTGTESLAGRLGRPNRVPSGLPVD
ncbi:MAG: cytochrome c peroxidase [Pseudomonadota bacterium]